MFSTFKPTILLALALTAIASPIANPTVDDANTLVARATRKDVDCNGVRFTKADIHNAIEQSKVVEKGRETNARAYGKYPAVYGNGEGIFGSTSTLYEYPLVSGTYSGSKLPHFCFCLALSCCSLVRIRVGEHALTSFEL